MKRLMYPFGISVAVAVLSMLSLSACTVKAPSQDDIAESSSSVQGESRGSAKSTLAKIYDAVETSGKYTTRDSVAAYLCKFDKLPGNYVGKSEGQKLYEAKGKNFSKWNFNPWTTLGVMIGGDRFSNLEGLLPEGNYHEADVEYSAKNRGTKRLVYQSNCIIYYTADHYETYSLMKF